MLTIGASIPQSLKPSAPCLWSFLKSIQLYGAEAQGPDKSLQSQIHPAFSGVSEVGGEFHGAFQEWLLRSHLSEQCKHLA